MRRFEAALEAPLPNPDALAETAEASRAVV